MTKLEKRAFFIMAFGRHDLERVWKEVYKPVVNDLGFEAVRSDERDNGAIVIDQIINDISSGSDLIIGDLTYERPNCYFEIGYARAVREHFEVILCSRRDHVNHSDYRPKKFLFEPPMTFQLSIWPKYSPPKVHFDLAGYDVVSWEVDKLDEFRIRFQKRFEERMQYIREHKSVPSGPTESVPIAQPSTPTELDAWAERIRKEIDK